MIKLGKPRSVGEPGRVLEQFEEQLVLWILVCLINLDALAEEKDFLAGFGDSLVVEGVKESEHAKTNVKADVDYFFEGWQAPRLA